MADDEQRQIDAIAAANHDTFAAVYRAHKDSLLTSAALLLGGDRSAAEDVLHDVFLQLVEQASSLRLRSSLRNYLTTCCLNRARDHLKKQSTQRRHLESLAESSSSPDMPVDDAAAGEEVNRVFRLLAKLPDEQREVVTLHIHGEMTFAELAETLSISVNTAKSRYRYALEKLQKWWPDNEIEQESKDGKRT